MYSIIITLSVNVGERDQVHIIIIISPERLRAIC